MVVRGAAIRFIFELLWQLIFAAFGRWALQNKRHENAGRCSIWWYKMFCLAGSKLDAEDRYLLFFFENLAGTLWNFGRYLWDPVERLKEENTPRSVQVVTSTESLEAVTLP